MADRRPDNAADPAQIRGAERRRRRLDLREEDDLRHVASTIAGRRFLGRVLDRCGLNRSSLDDSTMRTFQYEGERNIGLWLKLQLDRLNDDTLLTMLQEKLNLARREQLEADAERVPSAHDEPQPTDGA